jgi:type I restriction enzyme R subunit
MLPVFRPFIWISPSKDEKENGLIVDYGNVYKQLEKAYATYGEGGKTRGGEDGEEIIEKPLEMLVQMEEELAESIKVATGYLSELGFELAQLFDAKAMEKLALLKKAADCVCLNATSRVSYETAARLVFRKYKALYPETQVIPYTKSFNAIEAIYNLLNQRVNEADVNSIIWALQKVVNESIFIDKSIPSKDVEIDLSKLDFEKLRAAFLKAERKNTIVFDLQEAIDNQLQRMLQENPLRMEFYERYIEIIEEYNNGKSPEDVVTAFDDLTDFLENLTYEDARAMRENLDQETLAIFDLLREGKDLEESEKDEVKIVAKNTLKKLKKEKLTIERWRESRQITAQVKTMIYDNLQWLPSKSYTDSEVGEKAIHVYQHVYSRYGSGLNI